VALERRRNSSVVNQTRHQQVNQNCVNEHRVFRAGCESVGD
jgi:hypothetical protein